MKFLPFALVLLATPAFAEEPVTVPPKTYEQGVCAGYRSATGQIVQGRQQLLAIIAGNRSEAVGLLLTALDNVVFAQLDATKVTVDGVTTDCAENPAH
jgi:hypothetical protein